MENEEGLWQVVISDKYLPSWTLSQCNLKPYHSHFWVVF
jgi:hypothetical protein